jgi:hypothetical protein
MTDRVASNPVTATERVILAGREVLAGGRGVVSFARGSLIFFSRATDRWLSRTTVQLWATSFPHALVTPTWIGRP